MVARVVKEGEGKGVGSTLTVRRIQDSAGDGIESADSAQHPYAILVGEWRPSQTNRIPVFDPSSTLRRLSTSYLPRYKLRVGRR